MPVVFVHGVNVRHNDVYRQEVLLRNQLLLNIFLPRLGLVIPEENLFDAFWGDLAPEHRPGNLFLPVMQPLSERLRHLLQGRAAADPLEDEDSEDFEEGTEVVLVQKESSLLEMLRSEPIKDVFDSIIAFLHDERGAEVDLTEHSKYVAHVALKAMKFADKFSSVESQRSWLEGATSDEDVINRLTEVLSDDVDIREEEAEEAVRFRRTKAVLKKSRTWLRGRLGSAAQRILAPAVQARLRARARIEAARRTTRSTTTRLAARTFHPARRFFHRQLANFIGDSFFYFGMRGTREYPGLVPQRVLAVLEQARERRTDDDPYMIVIAHSMGGIVMCDIVSHFMPEHRIDCLVSVGSQFPLFADLCMFPGLDHTVLPIKKPAAVANWINIFDPNDFLGFAASQLFEGIVDVEYASGRVGVATHADYFKFPSFYECMAQATRGAFASTTPER